MFLLPKETGWGEGVSHTSVYIVVQMFYREGYRYISVSCTMNHIVCFATGRVMGASVYNHNGYCTVLVLYYRDGYGYISV